MVSKDEKLRASMEKLKANNLNLVTEKAAVEILLAYEKVKPESLSFENVELMAHVAELKILVIKKDEKLTVATWKLRSM